LRRIAVLGIKVFSGTGFSLCDFDLWQRKVKRTQAEAYATENLPLRSFDTGNRTGHTTIVKFM
jgi:hypothetical protein